MRSMNFKYYNLVTLLAVKPQYIITAPLINIGNKLFPFSKTLP